MLENPIATKALIPGNLYVVCSAQKNNMSILAREFPRVCSYADRLNMPYAAETSMQTCLMKSNQVALFISSAAPIDGKGEQFHLFLFGSTRWWVKARSCTFLDV